MGTLTVKLPASLDKEIAQAARRQRITKSELVRRAAQTYIAGEAQARPSQSALDLAGKLAGSVTDAPADLATNPRHLDGYGE